MGFWTNTNGTYSQNGVIAPTNPGLIRFYSAGHFTAEGWHGISVGVVPEPSSYAPMAAGLAGLGLVARRRRRV